MKQKNQLISSDLNRNKTLFLMCGPSGAGKSTWVREQCKGEADTIHVSRDVIRFSMLGEDDNYFDKENEVFDEFIRQINDGLKQHDVVFADATHLNEKSRNKTLDRINLDGVRLIAVNFDIPVEICLKQNELRKGTPRAYVPRSVIRRMAIQYDPAHDGEKHGYDHIITACVKE